MSSLYVQQEQDGLYLCTMPGTRVQLLHSSLVLSDGIMQLCAYSTTSHSTLTARVSFASST